MLDNFAEEHNDGAMVKGQRLRSEPKLEKLFEEAGLLIHSKTSHEVMPGDHCDVVAWALY